MWKSILSIKGGFKKCIRCRANNGEHIYFWNDLWCGNSFLKDQFPSLSLVDRRHRSVINFFFFPAI